MLHLVVLYAIILAASWWHNCLALAGIPLAIEWVHGAIHAHKHHPGTYLADGPPAIGAIVVGVFIWPAFANSVFGVEVTAMLSAIPMMIKVTAITLGISLVFHQSAHIKGKPERVACYAIMAVLVLLLVLPGYSLRASVLP